MPGAKIGSEKRLVHMYRKVLEALTERDYHPYQLYPVLWPTGDGGTNSTKGGPSGSEFAVNTLIGRMNRQWGKCVLRKIVYNDNGKAVAQGELYLTPHGKTVLHRDRSRDV